MEYDLVRSGLRPEADRVRDRAGVARDRGGARPSQRLEPPRRVRAGHRQQVQDDRVRAVAAGGGASLVDDPPGAAHLVHGAR